MSICKCTRLYKEVAGLGTETDVYVVPNGKKFFIYELGGNACLNNNVKVQISFGDTILFSTHGDSVQKRDEILIGDGETELKIILKNDTINTETIGGYYQAIEEE